jgi:hypothetical protein
MCYGRNMSIELAEQLHTAGKGHAWAACLLYRASLEYAGSQDLEDPEAFAFNGPASLSVHYLLGLGLELMLKAAVAGCDEGVDRAYLQNTIGHDLTKALDEAEAREFVSQAPHLKDLLELLREPYKQHWFRYERPTHMNLPGDFVQVEATLEVLESELAAKLQTGTEAENPNSCG